MPHPTTPLTKYLVLTNYIILYSGKISFFFEKFLAYFEKYLGDNMSKKGCNRYKQRVCGIFEDVPEPLVWRNFEGSLMIVRRGLKDPP